jgi:ribonuclease BN (tRNA processing enzyme)
MPEVVFVGTGDAFGSGGRRNSAILVRERGRTLLLDCGPTTGGGLRQLGIDPREIDAIAISHFHGDHVAGVPFLLLDYVYETPRRKPLEIYGPATIRERVERIARALEFTPEREPGYALHFREFDAGKTLELEGFRITPLEAHHAAATHPHMLRVDTENRSLVFSGDTGWHETLPDKVGDADLFICECVFVEPGSYSLHLSVRELESQRRRFRCGSMRLTHLGREVLSELDRVPFDLAEDGLRIRY